MQFDNTATTSTTSENMEDNDGNLDNVLVKLKETRTGYTLSMDKDNIQTWEDNVISYFNGIDIYTVERKELSNNVNINIKNKDERKKKDFTFSFYVTTGTISIQSKKMEDLLNHLQKIAARIEPRTLLTATKEIEKCKKPLNREEENSNPKTFRYEITKDDQVVI